MSDSTKYLNGRIEILIDQHEMRMSHWVNNPKVIDTTSGTTLLDLHGSLWDLLWVKELDSSLILQLRKYPGASNPIEIGLSIGRDGGTFNGHPLDGPGLVEALKNYS